MQTSFKQGFIKQAALRGIPAHKAELLFKNAGIIDDLKAAVKAPGQADMANTAINTQEFDPSYVEKLIQGKMTEGGNIGALTGMIGTGGGALLGGGLGALTSKDPVKRRNRALVGGGLGALLGANLGGNLGGQSAAGNAGFGVADNYATGLTNMFKQPGM